MAHAKGQTIVESRSGYYDHKSWEEIRTDENECDAEKRLMESVSEQDKQRWWDGWLLRSDEWRTEIGHEG